MDIFGTMWTSSDIETFCLKHAIIVFFYLLVLMIFTLINYIVIHQNMCSLIFKSCNVFIRAVINQLYFILLLVSLLRKLSVSTKYETIKCERIEIYIK